MLSNAGRAAPLKTKDLGFRTAKLGESVWFIALEILVPEYSISFLRLLFVWAPGTGYGGNLGSRTRLSQGSRKQLVD